MSIKGDFDLLWSNYPQGFSHNHALDPRDDDERIAKLNESLRRKIGKKVNNPSFKNLCAIRLSYTMNRSGLKIPQETRLNWYKRDFDVLEGDDGYFYGHGVVEMFHYISEKYGKADYEFSGPFATWQGGVVGGVLETLTIPKGLKSKKGIMIFFVHLWRDAQGHATLWDGDKCADNDYFELADKVMLWEVIKPAANNSVRIHNLNDAIRIIAKPIPECARET